MRARVCMCSFVRGCGRARVRLRVCVCVWLCVCFCCSLHFRVFLSASFPTRTLYAAPVRELSMPGIVLFVQVLRSKSTSVTSHARPCLLYVFLVLVSCAYLFPLPSVKDPMDLLPPKVPQ